MSKEDDKYSDQQYAALSYSNTQFDKNVLFIASGALGISFAFIEKIIPDLQTAIHSKLLIRSWYFFAGVIFLSLVAHFSSILIIRWSIRNSNCKKYVRKEKYRNYIIRGLNISMIIGLLMGILDLIRFIKFNI